MAALDAVGRPLWTCPDPPPLPGPTALSKKQAGAIVLDNGSSTFRAGYASAENPHVDVENIMSRYKDRKANVSILLAGAQIHIDAASKASSKSPFDTGIVCQWDAMVRFMSDLTIRVKLRSCAGGHA